jgi:hypothetical protein
MAGTTEPVLVVLRSADVTLVMAKVVEVALASMVLPVNVFASARSVDDAKVQVEVENE